MAFVRGAIPDSERTYYEKLREDWLPGIDLDRWLIDSGRRAAFVGGGLKHGGSVYGPFDYLLCWRDGVVRFQVLVQWAGNATAGIRVRGRVLNISMSRCLVAEGMDELAALIRDALSPRSGGLAYGWPERVVEYQLDVDPPPYKYFAKGIR